MEQPEETTGGTATCPRAACRIRDLSSAETSNETSYVCLFRTSASECRCGAETGGGGYRSRCRPSRVLCDWLRTTFRYSHSIRWMAAAHRQRRNHHGHVPRLIDLG